MTSAPVKVAPGSGLRAALVVAAAASAGAGLVHAAAAGSHEGSGTLVWLFAACAAAQLGWAAAVVLVPNRPVLVLGVGINGAAVAAWFLSRTVGLPYVKALTEVEAVGTADLIGAALGALAVSATLLAITQPISRRSMPNTWSALVVVATVALVMPALVSGHAHGGHDHLAVEHVHAGGDAHEHGEGEVAAGDGHAHGHSATTDLVAAEGHSHDADSHEHSAGTGTTGGSGSTAHPHTTNDPSHPGHANDPTAPPHSHPTDPAAPSHEHPTDPAAPPHEHPPVTDPTQPSGPPHEHPTTPTGPIVSLDDPRLTASQQAAGSALLVSTLAAMRPFPDVAAVQAAGYRSIGDAGTGFEHFVNWTYYFDGIELDPQRIESIVIRVEPNGAKTVASGMYILNQGKTLAEVPDIAGALTAWHNHTNLCWVPNGEGGMKLSGVTDANGQCAVGTNYVTPPMLHVWLTPQDCGPFAGIEGLHGGTCGHTHDASATLS